MSRTFAEARRIEEVLDQFIGRGHIAAYQTTVGSSQTTGPGSQATGLQSATIVVSLPEDFPEDLGNQIRAALPEIPGATLTVDEVANTPTSADIELIVSGPEFGSVSSIARQLEARVIEIPGVINVSSNVSQGRDEVRVRVDPRDAADFGLTTTDVARQVNLYIAGRPVTEVDLEGVEMDVTLRAQPEDVDSIDKIKSLSIEAPTSSGFEKVKLGFLAHLGVEQGPVTISQLDGDRSATIEGLVVADDVAGVGEQVEELIASLEMPPGVKVKIGGVFEDIADAFSQTFQAMGVGMVLIFIILVAIQGTLRNPLAIILSMPLVLVGGIAALLLTGRALGISGMMGFLMLIGIVTTNALVLIEFVEQLRRQGYSIHDALVEGGRIRVRLILMTAATTTFALVPLALGLGGSTGIIGAKLATVVIGGLMSSTILTLLVVPVIYTILQESLPGALTWVGSHLRRGLSWAWEGVR